MRMSAAGSQRTKQLPAIIQSTCSRIWVGGGLERESVVSGMFNMMYPRYAAMYYYTHTHRYRKQSRSSAHVHIAPVPTHRPKTHVGAQMHFHYSHILIITAIVLEAGARVDFEYKFSIFIVRVFCMSAILENIACFH